LILLIFAKIYVLNEFNSHLFSWKPKESKRSLLERKKFLYRQYQIAFREILNILGSHVFLTLGIMNVLVSFSFYILIKYNHVLHFLVLWNFMVIATNFTLGTWFFYTRLTEVHIDSDEYAKSHLRNVLHRNKEDVRFWRSCRTVSIPIGNLCFVTTKNFWVKILHNVIIKILFDLILTFP